MLCRAERGEEMMNYKRIFCLFGLAILLAPLAVATVPISSPIVDDDEPIGWWTETTVDRNQNKIGDMVELHIDNPIFLDEDNTLHSHLLWKRSEQFFNQGDLASQLVTPKTKWV